MITQLINRGFAYESQGNVLFDVKKYQDYGSLSKKNLDDLNAGSRIKIESYKKNPLDFILWKPSQKDDPEDSFFDSPWSRGRPGWHIECSAMSNKFLGSDFDIHGGGADLKFPHHENEIAQSVCANQNSSYAKYWLHNGFLTINGDKMSKSLGNFVNLHDLIQKHHPMVVRYALMSSHYRKPLNFTDKLLQDAQIAVDKFYNAIVINKDDSRKDNSDNEFLAEIKQSLANDLNLSPVFNILHKIAKNKNNSSKLLQCLEFLGLYDQNLLLRKNKEEIQTSEDYIKKKIIERSLAKKEGKWDIADKIRDELKNKGIVLEDVKNGPTKWHY
jgi:cysteinyl-tRNA synthetase